MRARMEPGHEVGWKSKSNLNGKPVCLEENKGLFSKEEVLGRWNTRWGSYCPGHLYFQPCPPSPWAPSHTVSRGPHFVLFIPTFSKVQLSGVDLINTK